MHEFTATDHQLMARALRLAERGAFLWPISGKTPQE